ncbi:hypothetical protein BJQ89_02931 [Arthrobacter sp. ES1]|nr:hypothetical protein [Arthrobacter sp. ES1]
MATKGRHSQPSTAVDLMGAPAHTVRMKFTTTILGSGNKVGIEVPEDIVVALGAGRRPPVVVTVNGKSYRSSIAVMGGQNMVGVSAVNRELTGVSAGDTVEVDVEVDTEPRIIDVPEDLAAALATEPEAKAFYATLNYSSQRRYVEPIANAKTAETRSRRVAKVVTDLKAGLK